MRKLTTFLCLTFAVLLGSAREGFALPPCPEGQNQRFHNCFGTYTFGPSSQFAGDKYVGEHRDGKYNGQGTYTFGPSSQFAGGKIVGEWRDGKMNGQGTITFGPSSQFAGDKFVGEFRDDKRHGQGTYTFADGEKYVGEYRDDNYNGQGTYTFGPSSQSAGDKYVGEFRDGKRHGQGIYTHADGRVKEGIFENGEFKYAKKVSPIVTAEKSPPPQVEKKRKPSRKSGTSLGSGFFISKLGHVITNQHVVNDCRKVTIGDNSKKQVTAGVLETDRRNDLALLLISSMQTASDETKSLIRKLDIKVVPLASHGLLRSEDVELGERVMVAGFPYGEIFSDTIKVTGGMVSAIRGMGDDSGQFQIDAAVQPGNSGGPIYDENGNIVGVVISRLNKLKVAKAIGSLPENVNFGIKASTVKQFLTSSGLPTKWSKRSKSMSTREIAKIAKSQTVMVVCHQ